MVMSIIGDRPHLEGWKPNAKRDWGTVNVEPSLTKQEFAKDADINVILKRCGVSGSFPVPPDVPPVFADVSQIGDYADCVRRVHAANEAFMELPADLRNSFDNDPVKLVGFLQDPSNKAKAIEMGLIEKPVEPVPPAPAPAAAAPVAKP